LWHPVTVPVPVKTGSIERDELAAALRQVAGGSQAALSDVYDRTSAKLFGICIRILGEREEAEDALQEIFISVWRNADRFDAAKGSPITWLAAMARNRSIDRKRSRASRPLCATPDVLTQLHSAEHSNQIEVCLRELEEGQQRPIRAAFYDGLSYPELARQSHVPLGTMKSLIRRGLLRLKECLQR
jgi:RNA polymerase sigma-70 factor (ECF subfamily)